jgi:hypothetical protein
MKSDTVPGQISVLYKHLRPAVEKSGGNLDKAIGLNAEHQAELLRTSSTVVKEALKGGKLKAVLYGSESRVEKDDNGMEHTRSLIWTDTWLKRDGKRQVIAAQDNWAESK